MTRTLLIILFLLTLTTLYGGGSWDKSSLTLSGYCKDDTNVFVITNKGQNMTTYSQYRIYWGNNIYFGSIKLNAGDSLVKKWYSASTIVKMEVDQPQGHPGNSHPKLTLDCYYKYLPITLTSIVYNDGDIEWSTSSELNNETFDIELSLNCEDFLIIGSVPGSGSTTTTTHYTYTPPVYPYPVYYRLKQIDYDGKYTYSAIIFHNNIDEKNIIKIYDLLGYMIPKKYKSIKEFLSDETIVSGIYIIETNKSNYKIIKF